MSLRDVYTFGVHKYYCTFLVNPLRGIMFNNWKKVYIICALICVGLSYVTPSTISACAPADFPPAGSGK